MVAISHPISSGARPFGAGLRDEDLRMVVASTDIRYHQTLRAVVVRRSGSSRESAEPFAAELIVLNTRDNIATLKTEAHELDPHGSLGRLVAGEIADVVLKSAKTGERAMITSLGAADFKRVEQVAGVEQIHIGAREDRGSWVCRMIDADRLDALFGGRIIDVRG